MLMAKTKSMMMRQLIPMVMTYILLYSIKRTVWLIWEGASKCDD